MAAQTRERFFAHALNELNHARTAHPPLNSLHEGYAVLLEEVDELWEEVKKKASERRNCDVYAECMQIAAMAGAIATEVCPNGYSQG